MKCCVIKETSRDGHTWLEQSSHRFEYQTKIIILSTKKDKMFKKVVLKVIGKQSLSI